MGGKIHSLTLLPAEWRRNVTLMFLDLSEENSLCCWQIVCGTNTLESNVSNLYILVLVSLVASKHCSLGLFNKMGTLQLHPRSTDPFLIVWELGGVRYCQDANGW